MTNTYQPVSDYGRHLYGDEPFEAELTPADEADLIGAKHIEQVPRAYRVLVDNYGHGGQGEQIEAAYPVETEAALIFGGILERVDEPEEAYEDRKKAELQAEAESRGLPTSGTKAELAEALTADDESSSTDETQEP